jgi:hypothetical protein
MKSGGTGSIKMKLLKEQNPDNLLARYGASSPSRKI